MVSQTAWIESGTKPLSTMTKHHGVICFNDGKLVDQYTNAEHVARSRGTNIQVFGSPKMDMFTLCHKKSVVSAIFVKESDLYYQKGFYRYCESLNTVSQQQVPERNVGCRRCILQMVYFSAPQYTRKVSALPEVTIMMR